MTALSLAGALLVMAPGLASATEIHADGPGGLLMVAGHPAAATAAMAGISAEAGGIAEEATTT